MNTLYQTIKSIRPCKEGLRYASKCTTTDELLANVRSGDWLLWLAYKFDVDIKVITKAKVECARYMMGIVKTGDEYQGWTLRKEDVLAINECLNIADAYCDGTATEDQMTDATHRIYNRFPKSSGYISPGGHLCIPIYFAMSKHAELCCQSIATTVANYKNAFNVTDDEVYDEIVENIDNVCKSILHRHLDDLLVHCIYNRLTSVGYER